MQLIVINKFHSLFCVCYDQVLLYFINLKYQWNSLHLRCRINWNFRHGKVTLFLFQIWNINRVLTNKSNLDEKDYVIHMRTKSNTH